MAEPRIGEMVLYDYIRPPLYDGEYKLGLDTAVTIGGAYQPLDGQDFHFNVEGPRFALAPTEVAGVFPPRNGHGSFDSALPHVALGRRTLPWERPLAASLPTGPNATPYPWLALVLLEESEYEIKRNMALADVVPAAVLGRLGRPAGIRCDAVEADQQLLRNILPMPEELQLLTHVRHVNVDDRELSAGDSDGYFAVVMGNRVPRSGSTYCACLVSVEERTDLLPTTDVVQVDGTEVFVTPESAEIADVTGLSPSRLGTSMTAADADRLLRVPSDAAQVQRAVSGPRPAQQASAAQRALVEADASDLENRARQAVVVGGRVLHPTARLVLLHNWTFTCDGDGTFRQLMQQLDVGMIGDADPDTKLVVADTGHTRIDVVDRLGAPEQAWYRGPLVPQPLTRDPLGPYHSADQARRVVPDTGAENISYAAAFEVGRLLAAADARLAQELMRWRRGAYSLSSRQTYIDLFSVSMRLAAVIDPLDPVALRYSVDVLGKIADGAGPLGDPYDMDVILASPLFRPAVVAAAFGLPSAADALRLLGSDPALSTPVAPGARPPGLVDLGQVLADSAGLRALADVRARAIDNATTTIRGGGA